MEKLSEVKPPALSRCCQVLTQHPREVEHGLMSPCARLSVPRAWWQRWHGRPGTRKEGPQNIWPKPFCPPARASCAGHRFRSPIQCLPGELHRWLLGRAAPGPGGLTELWLPVPSRLGCGWKTHPADGLHLLSHWENQRFEGGWVWAGPCPQVSLGTWWQQWGKTKSECAKGLLGVDVEREAFPRVSGKPRGDELYPAGCRAPPLQIV